MRGMQYVSTGRRECTPTTGERPHSGRRGGRRMTSSARWYTSWRWAVAALWLIGSVMDVSAQEGRWERVTAAGVQAFAQGDYAEAARQFQAALPLAEAWRPSDERLATSLMHLAA